MSDNAHNHHPNAPLTPNPEVHPTYQKLYNMYNETGRELTQVSHRIETFSRYTQLLIFS